MSVKQISIFLENKPGFLAEVTKVLGQNNIDMRAFSLAESNDFGIARIIVDDVYKTTTVLKDAGYINSVIDVLAVPLPDVPGGLSQVLKVLGDAQVNVEYMYAFLGGNSAAKPAGRTWCSRWQTRTRPSPPCTSTASAWWTRKNWENCNQLSFFAAGNPGGFLLPFADEKRPTHCYNSKG